MAKHCDVCNQDYADELAACPHCAEAKRTQLASRAEDRTTQLAEQPRPEHLASDAEIDLGEMPTPAGAGEAGAGAPPSDISDVAWAALVEEPEDEVKIDSPSDVDLLKQGAEGKADGGVRPGSDPTVDLGATPEGKASDSGSGLQAGARPGSDSVVDLGATPAGKSSASGSAPPSGSEVFMAELASDASRVDYVRDSGVQLGDKGPAEKAPPATGAAGGKAEEGARPHSESVVDLGALAEGKASASGSAPQGGVRPGSDSVVDLGATPEGKAPDSGSGLQAGARPGSDSVVDLGATPAGKAPASGSAPPSGSEVFMAELASDVSAVDYVRDLGDQPGDKGAEEKAPPASAEPEIIEAIEASSAEETPAAELTEEAALDVASSGDDSSAVDLGAPPPNVDMVEPAEGEPVEVKGDSGVNLEGLAVPPPSGSASHLTSDSAVDLGSQEEIAMPQSPSDAAAEPAPKGARPPSVPSASEVALDELEGGPPAGEPPAEEPAVSEAEVNELLNNLEETPASEPDLAAADAAEGEAAVAAAEQEVAAEEEQAAAAAEEEKPAKPTKPGSSAPALVGSTLLGILLGAGGLIGARFAGVDVPAMVGAGEKEKQASRPLAPLTQPQTQPQTQTPAPTFESRAEMVRRGDWEEATKAGIEQIDENKPEEVALRGDLRLNAYLAKAGSKINFQDPTLQLAVADLAKAAEAKNPDAIYDLGLMNELANKLDEARKEYTKGVQAFQNDPVQKRRFQSALHRVELKSTGAARGAFGPLPERARDRAALLALLLIGLQEPQPAQPQPGQPQPPAQPQAGAEEAGFEFWEASKLARDGKFADAIRMIDKAKSLHDQRRFTRLRKAQNPLSDPTEDIFLRCCDELKNYWALESHLREGGYLTDKNTPLDALQDALKKADSGGTVVKAVADKLIMEKVISKPEDMAKGIDRLIAEKKEAADKAAELTTQLKKSKDDAMALSTKLKSAEDAIKDREDKLKAASEREMKLKAANDELNGTFKKITDELAAAKLLDPNGKGDVPAAVRKAVEVAKTKDTQGVLRKQQSEIDRLTAALKLRRGPEEMLPVWLLVLQQNRNRPELARKAAQDMERLKADGQASAAQKGQAQIVLGLALRNTEKFAEARAALAAGRAVVDRGAWLNAANAALKEVSDPAAYYAGRAEVLYNRGRMNDALALLDRASRVLPAKEQGRLLARRSLIELDAAASKAKGIVSPAEPLLAAARRDADAAVKAGAAEGHYAAGRIAEELGQTDQAARSYRQALAAHSALDADGSRYRIALARVLGLPRETPPAPAAKKVSWSDPAPYPARYHVDVKLLVLAALFGLQAPGVADEQAGSEEAERLADEVLKAPADKVPFDVRAQALAVKGRWTLALQTYIEGVRPLVPREYSNGLLYLVRNHPRLKRPDSLRVPNPMEAEKHFAAGLNFYFERDYANAEKEFLLTVENDSSDARYYYFLGLSRLALNKRRDANDDFDQGAALERLNRPSPAAVSESLERIQGPARRIVNDIRDRPVR